MVCQALHLRQPLRAEDPDLSRLLIDLAVQPQQAIPQTPALKVSCCDWAQRRLESTGMADAFYHQQR